LVHALLVPRLTDATGMPVLERVIVAIGGLVGLGSGLLFYCTAEHLRLPALIFGIVDFFGVLAGSVVVGLFAAPIAIGALVMLVDWLSPSQQGSEDP
jgi:hypothetical protein